MGGLIREEHHSAQFLFFLRFIIAAMYLLSDPLASRLAAMKHSARHVLMLFFNHVT